MRLIGSQRSTLRRWCMRGGLIHVSTSMVIHVTIAQLVGSRHLKKIETSAPTVAHECEVKTMRRKRKTGNNPFPHDELFQESCRICEAYAGDRHSYEECKNCPVYRMAQRHVEIKKELDHMKYVESWNGVPDMGA